MAKSQSTIAKPGVYALRLDANSEPIKAYCDFDWSPALTSSSSDRQSVNAWLVIQRRLDGGLSFGRSWKDYEQGFGSVDGEYWLGLRHIHDVTSRAPYSVRMEMWDVNNVYWLADYETFSVDDVRSLYRLNVGGYHGNATDAMRYANAMSFSAPDRDNDVSSTHCAKFYAAGWWYKHCHYGNLNGKYPGGLLWFHSDLDEWLQLKRTVIKIRPSAASSSESTSSRRL